MLLLEGGFVIYGFMHALTCNDSVDLVMLPEIPVLSHTTSVMNVYCHFGVISLKKKKHSYLNDCKLHFKSNPLKTNSENNLFILYREILIDYFLRDTVHPDFKRLCQRYTESAYDSRVESTI